MSAPIFTQEQQLALWKWMAGSGLRLGTRYKRNPDPDADADDGIADGVLLLGRLSGSGYDTIEAEGETTEDAIANAIVAQAYSRNGLSFYMRGDERWYQKTRARGVPLRLTDEEARTLVIVWLKENDYDFLLSRVGPTP